MRIEIAIPVLNEEKNLEKQIKLLQFYIKKNLNLYREIGIVIADNGSTDGTHVIARRISQASPVVRIVTTEKPGVGAALKLAWSSSTADIVGYMDLDLATDLKHLKEAISSIEGDWVELVVGTRLSKRSIVKNRKFIRTLTSKCLNRIVRQVFKIETTDVMCGFKFLKKTKLTDLLHFGAKSDGWFFAAELLIVAKKLNFKVKEIPVEWSDDQESKVKIFKLSLDYLRCIRQLKRIFDSNLIRSMD
jgi:glycosyltransferase involved in cell wall biosynthesis